LCVFLNLCKKLKYFFWVEDMLKLEWAIWSRIIGWCCRFHYDLEFGFRFKSNQYKIVVYKHSGNNFIGIENII
jgi:hypothetical protein